MRKEICPEGRAMHLIMLFGKKEAMSWINEWMNIVEYVGDRERLFYWSSVERHINEFKIVT